MGRYRFESSGYGYNKFGCRLPYFCVFWRIGDIGGCTYAMGLN